MYEIFDVLSVFFITNYFLLEMINRKVHYLEKSLHHALDSSNLTFDLIDKFGHVLPWQGFNLDIITSSSITFPMTTQIVVSNR